MSVLPGLQELWIKPFNQITCQPDAQIFARLTRENKLFS